MHMLWDKGTGNELMNTKYTRPKVMDELMLQFGKVLRDWLPNEPERRYIMYSDGCFTSVQGVAALGSV